MTTFVLIDPLTKPLLRGWSHLVAFCVAPVAGAVLTLRQSGGHGVGAAVLYSICLVSLFGFSALYHRPNWSPLMRARMRRLDHSGILLMIAGTITPLSLILPPGQASALLLVAWGGAALGFLRTIFWPHAPKTLVALQYLAISYAPVLMGAPLVHALGRFGTFWIGLGGVFYTVGAVCYALRRPVLWPKVFGYHEVFHVLVIAAALCHFVAVSSVLDRVRGP
jgi:hemolysin III